MTHPDSIIAKRVAERTSKPAKIWGLSSAGRASALQAEGHRFEPYRPHIQPEYGGIAQLARAHGSYPWCRWFKSSFRYLKTSFWTRFFCVQNSAISMKIQGMQNASPEPHQNTALFFLSIILSSPRFFHTWKHPPPINSLSREFVGIYSLPIPTK